MSMAADTLTPYERIDLMIVRLKMLGKDIGFFETLWKDEGALAMGGCRWGLDLAGWESFVGRLLGDSL